MKHMRPVNRKAARIDDYVVAQTYDLVAAQTGDVGAPQNPRPSQTLPHVPMGFTLMFSQGWEVDAAGGTAGLCQPVERDIYDCFVTCYWPSQVPDTLNNYPNCASN